MNKRDLTDMHEEKKSVHIIEYLQDIKTRERIRQRMYTARSNASVTISDAARLFDFSENQLRDWERRGLLKTARPSTFTKQEGRGHRRYSTDELDKLALIKELVDGCGVTATEIPSDIDTIWRSLAAGDEQKVQIEQPPSVFQSKIDQIVYLPVNQRIENARKELAWRYFVSHTLRLALWLIAEDIPGTTIGLVLPLRSNIDVASVQDIVDLPHLGASLIAWQSQSLSSHILLTPAPSFDYSMDYRLQRLQPMKDNRPLAGTVPDNTFIVVRRSAKPLTLGYETVETIRILLQPIYAEVERSYACFGPGMLDILYPAPNLDNTTTYPDLILNGLADIIVQLGGQQSGQNRWRFCCILLPKDPHLPQQQQTLVVRAQSEDSPHKLGLASVSPTDDLNALSLRAFQSYRLVYRDISDSEEPNIAFQQIEQPLRSAIAVPVGGEDSVPLGVLYIASAEEEAFPEKERRVLRLMSRIVELVLRAYAVRQREIKNLGKIILSPDIVDDLPDNFPSENDFIHDLNILLADFKAHMNILEPDTSSSHNDATAFTSEPPIQDAFSFIAVDVDKIGSITTKYGDQMVRNLCWEVGQRILGELESTFKKYKSCRCYHIYADRFYILLKDVPYDQVLAKARLLKKSLDGSYKASILHMVSAQPPSSDSLQEVSITVRLAVSSFTDKTLKDILQGYPDTVAISRARAIIDRSLVKELKKGMARGGDVIMAWNPEVRRHEQVPKEG